MTHDTSTKYIQFSEIHIKNYKGIKDMAVPLSEFSCVIGENNSGKSSLMQGLLLFIKGTKLTRQDFYDPNEDILITVELVNITDDILNLLADEHKVKVVPFIKDGRLKLARRYNIDGSSKLRLVTKVPIDKKYDDELVSRVLKGKKGNDIIEVLSKSYPELGSGIQDVKIQADAKDLINKYIEILPEEHLQEKDIPLTTGIDNSIKALLPEPIYIPAVKELSDEIKTKEGTSFGKLLNILLNVIESELTEAKDTFESLRKKLNRIPEPDGSISDGRLSRIIAIERTVERNLENAFSGVSIELKIPPPEIKTILSNAQIVANDGVEGPVDNKGDGLRRAMAFSILRSYVELSQDKNWQKDKDNPKPSLEKFLFLFEEPELYLHPKAQRILFDALALISCNHQVLVTTHSPLFFSADATKTFIKLIKNKNTNNGCKPYTYPYPIDLSDMSQKDKFQLISFETSNIAFFSDKVVLVEGDSELIVFPHMAKVLNSKWDLNNGSIALVKINGKGSFKRYKDFFKCFNMKVCYITDLDILVKDFDKIEPTPHLSQVREDLLKKVDTIIDTENLKPEPNPKLIKEEFQRVRQKEILEDIRQEKQRYDNDNSQHEKLVLKINELFEFEKTNPRLEVIEKSIDLDIINLKRKLLSELREHNVFVLEKGAIEAYYPSTVTGRDKPSKAQNYCKSVNTREGIICLCEQIPIGDNSQLPELEAVFGQIFRE